MLLLLRYSNIQEKTYDERLEKNKAIVNREIRQISRLKNAKTSVNQEVIERQLQKGKKEELLQELEEVSRNRTWSSPLNDLEMEKRGFDKKQLIRKSELNKKISIIGKTKDKKLVNFINF